MDVGPYILGAALGAFATATLNGSVDTVVKSVAGGASLGSALMCVRELRSANPRWDEAAGRGAAYGAVLGGAWLFYSILEQW